jgi:hypothetical protein
MFVVAPVLVELRGLEGPQTALSDLHCHLHRLEYSAGRDSSQLRRPGLSSYCTGIWIFRRGLHGRWIGC